MKWWGYLIFGLLSLILTTISVLCTFLNPFSLMFLHLAAPAVRLMGYDAQADGWSSLGSAMVVNLLWPLTLTPLHWLSYRVLGWKAWGDGALFMLVNVMIAFAVLLVNAGS